MRGREVDPRQLSLSWRAPHSTSEVPGSLDDAQDALRLRAPWAVRLHPSPNPSCSHPVHRLPSFAISPFPLFFTCPVVTLPALALIAASLDSSSGLRTTCVPSLLPTSRLSSILKVSCQIKPFLQQKFLRVPFLLGNSRWPPKDARNKVLASSPST